MQFVMPPKTVGYWQIGGRPGLQLHLTQRPRWLTRQLCRVLLQWEWRDGTWESNHA